MEAEEIKDSVKAWFDNKLKNPYFAAVFAVWLITNKVVVFSLFNFTDELDVKERINLIHNQLQNKSVWVFQGFYGIIIYSFIVGLISMVAFNYANVLGKWFYNFFGKGANYLKKTIEPFNWVERFELEKIINEKDKLDKEIEIQATNIISLRQERQIALDSLSKLKEEKESNKDGLRIIELTKQLEEQKKLVGDIRRKQDNKLFDLNNQITIDNLLSEKNEENEIKNFLKSEYRNFFDAIFGYIKNHRPIGNDVTQYTLDFYHHNGLISMKDNLYLLTPKGERYYKEYLKVKETN